MATETEIKLTGDIARALGDAALRLSFREKLMRTTYFDTAARDLGAQKRMLRLRREGNDSIVCLKAPSAQDGVRLEWEVRADTLDDAALAALIALGAPSDLPAADQLAPLCGAEFTRRFALLHFPDGSCAEVAHDCGVFLGGGKRRPFEELELELKSGAPDAMRAFAKKLCQTCALREEPLSKLERAKLLL